MLSRAWDHRLGKRLFVTQNYLKTVTENVYSNKENVHDVFLDGDPYVRQESSVSLRPRTKLFELTFDKEALRAFYRSALLRARGLWPGVSFY